MITNAIIHNGIHTSFDIIGIQFYENIVQEQNSEEQNCDEQEVIPSDMLAVSYNNEWSSKVDKKAKICGQCNVVCKNEHYK